MLKQTHWMTVALISGLALAACNRPESPAETQSDMAEAAREASGDVTEAKHEAREARADNMENAAEAQEDVALAPAKADYKVAVEACDAQTGDGAGSVPGLGEIHAERGTGARGPGTEQSGGSSRERQALRRLALNGELIAAPKDRPPHIGDAGCAGVPIFT